jgi:hypothetical protein
MHAVRSWASWWLALFGLWVAMEGTNEAMELGAGAGAAALGATLAEVARRQGLLRLTLDPRSLAFAVRTPWRAAREFVVLTQALVLDLAGVRAVRSAWVAVPFEAGGDDRRSAGRRALRPLIDNVTPNTIVVDVDCERELALKHDLVNSRAQKTVP